jgi:AcrR family transcriptional regulator
MNPRSPSAGPKGTSLRTRIREATTAAILEAAEAVFAEAGLNGAHLSEIAAGAGVAVGTVYNHFKDRDAILAALLAARRGEMMEIMDEFLAQPSSGDFTTDLLGLMGATGGFLDRHKRFHHILHQCELAQNLVAYPETAARALDAKREIHVRIEKIIKRGLKLKALRPELADYYPSLLMGILRSVRQQQWVNDDRHLSIEDIVGFFMRGAANVDAKGG